jgi:hypothetical protein
VTWLERCTLRAELVYVPPWRHRLGASAAHTQLYVTFLPLKVLLGVVKPSGKAGLANGQGGTTGERRRERGRL